MHISVYGAGYVGLVSAACFAKLGHHVYCYDIDEEKIINLQQGKCPIHEKKLPEMLIDSDIKYNINFSQNLQETVSFGAIHFIATGTPSLPDGSADLSQVFAVATDIINNTTKDTIIVTKSTVPVGTGKKLQELAQKINQDSHKNHKIHFGSNPEFLREGQAVDDFLYADRVVIGGDDNVLAKLKEVYAPMLVNGVSIQQMNMASAELTKYAANTMLANRISFMNQIANIAEVVGADIEDIKLAMAKDSRIGSKFLEPGVGYGGSCFPKDTKALSHTATICGLDNSLFRAIDEINQTQKHWVLKKIKEHFQNDLQGKKVVLLGLAFKPDTDDLREASSLVIIQDLLENGVKIRAYDPIALPHAKKIFANQPGIVFTDSLDDVLSSPIDALIIATEWDEFKSIDLRLLSDKLDGAPIFDGRNCFPIKEISKVALNYYSVGRKPNLIHTKDL